ncbi:MAG: GNAT family N-acetyltransferase [Erysipelotrichaceae bacterium]|nr:GNAT family N-acetyltransferase [Erysipelotrichaceae bacterium]
MKVIELSSRDFDLVSRADAVERGTMGNYAYVETAWNYFFNSKGSFLCAYDNDEMVGIAHLAVMPDGAGWFEALRVLPEHQNQGVGKALYEKALELCDQKYHCTSLSIYTGRRNVRSSGLAERYGLVNVYDHKEYTLKISGSGSRGGFRYADWERATQLAVPLAEQYGNFISGNRTWYGVNEPNIRMLADQGFFREDEEGNFVCAGTRFQHGAKLFVLMLGGDYKKGLDYAVNLAYCRNIPEVTCTFCAVNEKLEQELISYGFTYVGELITRERIF